MLLKKAFCRNELDIAKFFSEYSRDCIFLPNDSIGVGRFRILGGGGGGKV